MRLAAKLEGGEDVGSPFVTDSEPTETGVSIQLAFDSRPDNVAKFGRGPGALRAAARGA